MRIIVLSAMILSLLIPSVCFAQDSPLKDAYALHYKGKTQEAIELVEQYTGSNPDPEALYFLGYAYYELKQFEKAAHYFNDAFSRKPFYSPMAEDKDAEKQDLKLKEDRP